MLSLFVLAVAASAEYVTDWHNGFRISSWDNTSLLADASVPEPQTPGEKFPIIIFMNSWAMPREEYEVKVSEFGKKGYVTVQYETRGWWFSGGQVGTASPDDTKDISAVIDYIARQAEWNADPTRVALAGISYGGGLALLGAATDPRVNCVMALSGWGDLQAALDQGGSPNLIWGTILDGIVKVVGRPPKELQEIYSDLMQGKDLTRVRNFTDQRSAIRPHFLDEINKRKVPILVSNNFEDRLFKPQDAVKLFNALEGPKQLILNQGIHASAELSGLVPFLPLPNIIWSSVADWVDFYLRGEGAEPPNGQVTIEPRNHKKMRVMANWPGTLKSTTVYLHPRGVGHFAELKTTAATGKETNTISFSRDSGMNNGVPVLSPILVYVDVPIIADLTLVSDRHSVVWLSSAFSETEQLCGDVTLSLPIKPSQEKWQLVAYLYVVENILGSEVGTLVSHGTHACWNCTANTPSTVSIPLRTFCFDAGKHRKLALGVDMYSDMYKPANTNTKLDIEISYGSTASLSYDTYADA